MESSRGQTLGKMVLKLRRSGPTGSNPTLEQALRRNIFYAANLLGDDPLDRVASSAGCSAWSR